MLQPIETHSQLRYGILELSPALRKVIVRGQAVRLTPIEYRLLASLVAANGRIVSARQLLTAVWGKEYADCENYLWVHLSRLRRKFQSAGLPSFVENKRGVGYRVCDADARPSPTEPGPRLLRP